jgi:RNA methyltransferase, TrmH family
MAHAVEAPATSARDPRVARARRLLRDAAAREAERAVALDGLPLLATALALGTPLEVVLAADPAALPARLATQRPALFAAGDASAPTPERPAAARGAAGSLTGAVAALPLARAAPDALRALAALGQPPEVVAIARLPDPPAPSLPPRSLVLAGVHDPGNLGSIVRTAAALALPRVHLTTGDPFARRALRASQGAALAPGLVARGPLPAERPQLAAAVPRGGDVERLEARRGDRHGEVARGALGGAAILARALT